MIIQKRFLVLGQSHVQAIAASADLPSTFEVHRLKSKTADPHGGLEMDDAKALVKSLKPTDALILTILGTLHNIYGLVNHEQPFSLASSFKDNKVRRMEIIPVNVMRALFQERIAKEQVVTKLFEISPCPVFHCMTPPPKEFPKVPGKIDKIYRGRSIADLGFAPPEQRMALWEIENCEIEKYLAERKISHLRPPDGTTAPGGYLLQQYCAPDVTHANSAYGRRVIEQIVEAAGKTAD